MFKKYLNKIKHNEGSISLGAVLAIPAILLVVFLMIDYLHIASDKANLQRRVDAARSAGCKSTAERVFKESHQPSGKFNFYVKYYTYMYIDKYITSM